MKVFVEIDAWQIEDRGGLSVSETIKARFGIMPGCIFKVDGKQEELFQAKQDSNLYFFVGKISDLRIEKSTDSKRPLLRTITINASIPIVITQLLNDFLLKKSEMKVGDYVHGDGYLVGQVFLGKNQKKKAVKCKVLKTEVLKGPKVPFKNTVFAAKRYFVELEVKT